MPNGSVDPATLGGEDLVQWYRRSPWDIEQERQAARQQQYNDFFGIDSSGTGDGGVSNEGAPTDPSDVNGGGDQSPSQTSFPVPSFGPTGYVPGLLGDLSALTSQTPPQSSAASGSDQNGASTADADQQLTTDGADEQPSPIFDTGLATDGDATWIPAGGKTPRQRRQWSQHTGQDWPTVPETGENYHLHHYIPKADGGSEELDNFGPMEPSAHLQHHMDNGDFSRWAKRWWAGKSNLPEVQGLGILQLIPDITGILSGRIRMDSMDNFSSDMLGVPSQQDIRQYHEQLRKKFAPNMPPGTVVEEL